MCGVGCVICGVWCCSVVSSSIIVIIIIIDHLHSTRATYVSLEDCDMLTWSLGWTGFLEPSFPPRISIARFESTFEGRNDGRG